MTAITGICWLGTPRSGSNYLTDLMGNHPDIESYREIFQARGVHAYSGVAHYGKRLVMAARKKHGVDYKNPKDPRLVEWARTHPKALLTMLDRTCLCQYYSYKIFVEHLMPEPLRKAILHNPTQSVIVFHRDPLDCFISSRKTVLTEQYHNVDTTELLVTLDAAEFERYHDRQQGFLTECTAAITQAPLVIRYEELMLLPNDHARLVHLCIQLRQSGIDLDPHRVPTDIEISTARQDRNRHVSEKVENWEAFLADCAIRGLGRSHSRHLPDVPTPSPVEQQA